MEDLISLVGEQGERFILCNAHHRQPACNIGKVVGLRLLRSIALHRQPAWNIEKDMGRRTKINLYCITQIDRILTCPWLSSPSCTWSRASAPPLHLSSLPTCVGSQGYGSAARRTKTRDVSCITETRFSFDSYLLSASSVDAVCLQAVMSEQKMRSARGEARNRAPELTSSGDRKRGRPEASCS